MKPTKFALHPIATAAAPTAYSSTSAHPRIHASVSPSALYVYAYALPLVGIAAAISAYARPASAQMKPTSTKLQMMCGPAICAPRPA